MKEKNTYQGKIWDKVVDRLEKKDWRVFTERGKVTERNSTESNKKGKEKKGERRKEVRIFPTSPSRVISVEKGKPSDGNRSESYQDVRGGAFTNNSPHGTKSGERSENLDLKKKLEALVRC